MRENKLISFELNLNGKSCLSNMARVGVYSQSCGGSSQRVVAVEAEVVTLVSPFNYALRASLTLFRYSATQNQVELYIISGAPNSQPLCTTSITDTVHSRFQVSILYSFSIHCENPISWHFIQIYYLCPRSTPVATLPSQRLDPELNNRTPCFVNI